jgi:hypothetical protein
VKHSITAKSAVSLPMLLHGGYKSMKGIKVHGLALARTSSNSKLKTRPLVREGAIK